VTPRIPAPHRRRPPRRRPDRLCGVVDDGFTLVEMTVAVLLLSVVVIVAANVITFASVTSADQSLSTKALEGTEVSSTAIQDALDAAVTIPSDASQFSVADRDSATFTASVGNPLGPVQVVVAVAAVGSTGTWELNVTETPPEANGANTVGSATAGEFVYTAGAPGTTYPVVGQSVVYSATPAVPLFTYYDANGNVVAPPGSAAAGLDSIASVAVSLTIPSSRNLGITTTISNRVYLGHAGFVVGVS